MPWPFTASELIRLW